MFRVVPRQCAADVFEFLDISAQERLLKALGQEQVAAILNDMADDDRTALLEELPAAATKQMLAVLTPEERARALALLGYPVGEHRSPDAPLYRHLSGLDRTTGSAFRSSRLNTSIADS